MNTVILIGRLTKDPEPRYTTSGVAVTRFTVAVDREYQKDGQKETDFIDIVTWRKLAEVVGNNLQKGRLVAVRGSLQIRSYDDNQGIRRKAAEIVAEKVQFLDYAKDKQGDAFEPESGNVSFNDDDVPF